MEPKLEDFQPEIIFDPAPPVEELPVEEAPQRKSGLLRFFYDIFETLLLAVLLFMGINAISARVRVDGSSMEPSFHHGEFVVVNRLSYKIGTYDTGDVVVFRYPRDPEQEYIKRIIGVAGDNVFISGGLVYVNDEVLYEPYIAAPPRYSGNWDIPEGYVFVLGDNRNNSSDSHNWGPLQVENVIGKAVFIYWPLDEFGGIESTNAISP
jgi:signal peptidase I